MGEYCAMCSTAEESLHARAVLEHSGYRVNTTLLCDSVAARSVVGKVKALEIRTPWLQEIVKERDQQIKPVTSKANSLQHDCDRCKELVES